MNRPREELVFAFGPFELVPSRRLLTEEGRPLRIGSRALDILVALVESAGQIVKKNDLILRVWNSVIVEDTNLRVQLSTLRRLLGDDGRDSRYIVHVARQGYVFVAPLMVKTKVPRPALITLPPFQREPGIQRPYRLDSPARVVDRMNGPPPEREENLPRALHAEAV